MTDDHAKRGPSALAHLAHICGIYPLTATTLEEKEISACSATSEGHQVGDLQRRGAGVPTTRAPRRGVVIEKPPFGPARAREGVDDGHVGVLGNRGRGKAGGGVERAPL